MFQDNQQDRLQVVLLGTVVAVLLLVLVGRVPGEGRWASELTNAAHAPAFAGVTAALIMFLRQITNGRGGVFHQYIFAVVVALLLGMLVEILQSMTGRDASIADLGRDALGAIAVTGFLVAIDRRVRVLSARKRVRSIGLLVGIVCTTIIMAPVVATGAAYLQRHRHFPTLVDFSNTLSTFFLGVYSAVTVRRETIPDSLSKDARAAIGLHARIVSDSGWGLALWEPMPDWRGYDSLNVDLANPTDFPLFLRVHIRDRSQKDDRRAGYLGAIEVSPHSRQVREIDLHDLVTAEGVKQVDLSRIHSVVLARDPRNRARDFYVMSIWLGRR